MSKSLQEQLRQAGLANQKQAVKARKAKNTKEKMLRKGVAVEDETAESIKRKDAEKLARDRALNEQRDQAARSKAIQAQIQQLIDMNVISERGDQEFSFTHEGVIKTLMLGSDVRQSLIRGALAIVGASDSYHIVPAQVARKITERDNSWLVLMNSREDKSDDDDAYAEYAIPDDLMW